jgi:YD repeat-containing protein
MKKILLLLSIITLFSCSSDDDFNNEQKAKKYVDVVTLTSNGETSTINLTYNDAKEIIRYSRAGTHLAYQYDQGRLVRVTDTDSDDFASQLFYTNGELTSFKQYESTYPVTYTAADNSYTFEGIGFKVGIAGRDIAYVNESGTMQKFSYSNDNKGPMYNVPTDRAYLVPLFSEYMYIILTSKPTTQFKINDDGTERVYNAAHTFDDEGYVTSTILRSSNEEFLSAQFHYVTL